MKMSSAYIIPEICHNSSSDTVLEMDVKSEPDSEDNNEEINDVTTEFHCRESDCEDEPLIDLNEVCVPQELVEYEITGNNPALLLLVEHKPKSTSDNLNNSANHSSESFSNSPKNHQELCESKTHSLKNEQMSLTKKLRDVKRKCQFVEAKHGISNGNVTDRNYVEVNASKECLVRKETRPNLQNCKSSESTNMSSALELKSYKEDHEMDIKRRSNITINPKIHPKKHKVRKKKLVRRNVNNGETICTKSSLPCSNIVEKQALNEINNTQETTEDGENSLIKCANKTLCLNDTDDAKWKELSKPVEVVREDQFECTVCNRRFREKSHLATHSRAHIDIRNFKCHQCGSKFKTKPNLYFHLKTHEEAPFVCEKCNKIFPERKMLVRHIRVVHSEGSFKCDQCGRLFNAAKKLELHYSVHTGRKPYTCEVCGKSFVYKSTYCAHMKGHTADREFRCDLCGSDGEGRRRCHHFSDSRPWLCTVCGNSYPLKATLKNHMKSHEPEKPFKCDDCGKSFMKKSTYECHLKKHSGEQPEYMCDQCSQSYFNYFALKRHYLKHTSERKFVCDICKKAFWTKDALKVHKRSHESVKLFECTQCSKCFAHKHTLVAHMRNHSTELQPQRHSCSLCLKTFVHKYNLSRHKCQSLLPPIPQPPPTCHPQPLPPSFVIFSPPKHLNYSTLHIL